jgi:hypothetical protein
VFRCIAAREPFGQNSKHASFVICLKESDELFFRPPQKKNKFRAMPAARVARPKDRKPTARTRAICVIHVVAARKFQPWMVLLRFPKFCFPNAFALRQNYWEEELTAIRCALVDNFDWTMLQFLPDAACHRSPSEACRLGIGNFQNCACDTLASKKSRTLTDTIPKATTSLPMHRNTRKTCIPPSSGSGQREARLFCDRTTHDECI